MSLVDLDDLARLLACPRCRSALVEAPQGLRCTASCCPYSAEMSFPTLERWPILVDFERSILEREQITSPSRANPGAHRWSIDRLPPLIRPLWKPRNTVAERNIETLLSRLAGPSPLVLVVGGGTVGNGVEALYADGRARVAGFDIYGSRTTQFVADAHQIPLMDGCVDAVVVQAVLEHVLDPAAVVQEIHRVLRPEGIVYAETPFMQPVHAGAYDFTRYTSSGHRHLFRAFTEIAAGPVAGPGAALLTSVEHVLRGVLRSPLAGKVARAALFWMRYLDRVIPMAYAMDDASAYYFLGQRSNTELRPNDIVGYYRGVQQ